MPLALAPPSFISDLVTSANGATERGDKGQTALTGKGLATALQTRPQQVGTDLSPLKMDFNPGRGEPGSKRVGVKPEGSTAVAPPAPAAIPPAAWRILTSPRDRGVAGEGEGPVVALAACT